MQDMIVYVVYSVIYPYLPVGVFDTQNECAEFMLVDTSCIRLYIKEIKHVYRGKYRLRKLKIDT